jgi:predicted short-subunit dehydrogenase-like oxidoreductase (DUF2520 family)
MKTVGIVGLGRIGTALAVFLGRHGYSVQIVRREQRLQTVCPTNDSEFIVTTLEKAAQNTDVIFITTPDDIIAEIVSKLQLIDIKCTAVLHMSGSLSSEILLPLKERGIVIGSLHPLQSFPNAKQAVENLPGSYFTFEGDKSLLPWISELIDSFEGVLKVLPSTESKAIYHAGAVIVSNYLVGLAQLGSECLEKAGFRSEEAREALLPLMRGTMNNLLVMPPEQALTGPVSRGDVGVIRSHLSAFKQNYSEALPAYLALASVLASISVQSGKISEDKYKELIQLLNGGGE